MITTTTRSFLNICSTEGLCESVENAEIMMAYMSEGWIEGIIEAKEDEGLSLIGKSKKRNQRQRTTTSGREARHKLSRGERGNYGINFDRYQPNASFGTRYPSIRRRGKGFTASSQEIRKSIENDRELYKKWEKMNKN